MTKQDKAAQDNRANQLNPTHPAYHRSRRASPEQAQEQASHNPAVLDNRSRQLNPQSSAVPRSGGPSGGHGRKGAK